MQKIRWGDLLSRLQELDSAPFSESQNGRVVREGIVARVEPVHRNIRVISKDGEEFFFPNDDTFAFQLFDGDILFKRHGRLEWCKAKRMWFQHIDSFHFQLKAPFLLPERTEEEREALRQYVLSRL